MLTTLFTGQNRIRLEETSSTQDFAEALLQRSPVPEGTLVTAQFQGMGRGFSGNVWESEKGKNLLLSIIFFPVFIKPEENFYLNKAASLAVYRTVKRYAGPKHPVHIKWPNDILLDEKKVSGILIRNQVQGSRLRSSIWGIGLNVLQTQFRQGYTPAACSLKSVTDISIDPENVLETLMTECEAAFLALRSGKFAETDREFLSALYGYGEARTFGWEGGVHRGTIAGVDKEGRIAIETDGALKKFNMKEIRFLF